MWKRLHTFYLRCYEHARMWMERHDPKPMQHAKDPAEASDWRPASAQYCPECTWQLMLWDVLVEQWVCPHCGTSRYPSLSITEKRHALLPPPKVIHLDPDTGQPMRLSKAYKRKTIDLGQWVQDRPVWKDTKMPVRTDELPHVRIEDRRKTG